MSFDVRVTVPNRYDYIISTSTNVPLAVDGINKLIQIITKAIKTDPGRDLFAPNYGMGIRSRLPVAAAKQSEQEALSAAAQGILKIQEEIIKGQEAEDLTPYEELYSLELLGLELDLQKSLWDLTVRVTSVAGTSARVTVES